MPRRHLSQLGAPGAARPGVNRVEGGRGYPRPQLRREAWETLDGPWDFAIDANASFAHPNEVLWDSRIIVPFAPETAMSGIGNTGLYKVCWYRRRVSFTALRPAECVKLHFGAVDYEATVWIDDVLVGSHEGGYTPFHIDITRYVSNGSEHVIVVRAYDDPGDLCKPRGKQDWQLVPHSIWYPRTTGIWQSVWVERVPKTHIDRLAWTPNLERWELGLEVRVTNQTEALRLRVELSVGDVLLARDEYAVLASEVHRRIALSDPGIDDFRNELLWCPASPKLIDAVVELVDQHGTTIDSVTSYTALRSFAVQRDRLILNGRPFPLRMVLNQGYWEESGMTAPDDAAMRRDVELAKQMGFNGVRMHQKIEDPRFLYWADRLGLLVWEEMPSAYRFTRQCVERCNKQWLEVLDRDASHPCIIAWVPFNESWGVPNLPQNEAERHYVRALYHLTKTIDPTRPVIGNDGWESVATDIIGIHDYDENARRLGSRYYAHEVLPKLLARERPGGRSLVIDGVTSADTPIVLSEFGGIAFSDNNARTWGYSRAVSSADLARRYGELLAMVTSLELLAGFCYTQFADTYQETNGLLNADRTPKFPLEQVAAATTQLMSHAPEPSLAAREGAPP